MAYSQQSSTDARNRSSQGQRPARNKQFYWDNVIFQVEDELFRVPKHPFMESPVFRTTFSLPRPPGTAEGESDDQPFKLEGVDKQTFGRFLQGLFRDSHVEPNTLGTEVWVAVLKLATMWEFLEIRKFAIQVLDNIGLSNVHKVVCGEEFKITRWLSDGYEALLRDKAIISIDDAERLGWKTAVRLLRVREMLASTQIESYRSLSEKATVTGNITYLSAYDRMTREARLSGLTRLVREEFGKDLDECGQAERLIDSGPAI